MWQEFYRRRKVLVTGGTGFVGSHVVDALLDVGAVVSVTTRNTATTQQRPVPLDRSNIIEVDLTDLNEACAVMREAEVVFNLAGDVAGIGYQFNHPGTMFYQNVRLNLNALEAARIAGVERYVCVSSSCVYRRHGTVPTPEEDGFLDDPEETSVGYGWAKRVAELQARFYAQEFGMKIAVVRPTNMYGPRDNFEPATAHAIPGIIMRAHERNDEPLVVWGSGTQRRSFLYVEDAAEGMLRAAVDYPTGEPLNLASNEEVTIGQVASMIVRISGLNKELIFDRLRPEGQSRKAASAAKAFDLIGWQAEHLIEDGLRQTIDWYHGSTTLSEGT